MGPTPLPHSTDGGNYEMTTRQTRQEKKAQETHHPSLGPQQINFFLSCFFFSLLTMFLGTTLNYWQQWWQDSRGQPRQWDPDDQHLPPLWAPACKVDHGCLTMKHRDMAKAPNTQHSNTNNGQPACRGQWTAGKRGKDNGNPTTTTHYHPNHWQQQAGERWHGGNKGEGGMMARGEWQQWMTGMHPTMRNDPAPNGEGGMMTTNNRDAPNDKEWPSTCPQPWEPLLAGWIIGASSWQQRVMEWDRTMQTTIVWKSQPPPWGGGWF